MRIPYGRKNQENLLESGFGEKGGK